MNINVSFEEITEYVKRRYGQRIGLSLVSEREVCVSAEKRIVFKTLSVSVNLRIEDVRPDGLTLSYNGGLGIDLIITGALVFLKSKLPELADVVVAEEGLRIRLEPTQLAKTRSLLEKITLRDLRIHKDGLTLSANLK